jgi:hypothetical protein
VSRGVAPGTEALAATKHFERHRGTPSIPALTRPAVELFANKLTGVFSVYE